MPTRAPRYRHLKQEGAEERLSAITVGELRRRLRADASLPEPHPSDAAAFAAWALAGILWHRALAVGGLGAAWWVARGGARN